MSLHNKIMSMPCAYQDSVYGCGHKDARHAAAALANEADAEISRLRETQRVLVEALRKIVAIDDKMFGGDWDEIEEARAIARGALASVEKPESVHLASAGDTEATARDAARYRWMRANAVVMADYAFSVDEEVEAVVDAAIAAMSTEPKP